MEFVEATCRVCWMMVVQQPPMEFKEAKEYDKDLQELLHGGASPDVPDIEIINVYPMLYHEDELKTKGKVFLLEKKEEE